MFKFEVKPLQLNRTILTLLIISLFFSSNHLKICAQNGANNTQVSFTRGTLTTAGGHLRLKSVDVPSIRENIQIIKKKYLTFTYELVTVDDFDQKAHLRYNIYDDEMEFVRENYLYYLVKEVGRKVYFEDTKSTYKIFKHSDKLTYFKVITQGSLTLLARHKVRHFEPIPAKSNYDKAKPEKYKRLKDELYLAIDHKVLTKLSGIKKSKLLKYFGNRKKEMKIFMKENNLNYKKESDLTKIIGYYNIL